MNDSNAKAAEPKKPAGRSPRFMSTSISPKLSGAVPIPKPRSRANTDDDAVVESVVAVVGSVRMGRKFTNE